MNIYITLDYELFFGNNSGSVENCIIKPTEALLAIVDPYNIKLSLFVDSGYLMALKRQMEQYPQLATDYNQVRAQLAQLSAQGHSVQLHIHPHWEDSFYNGTDWEFDTTRYKLSDFNPEQITDIVSRYHQELKIITGKPCTAYRAGGWSAQPFSTIAPALKAEQIFVDSTVFPGGYYQSSEQQYDFTAVPMHSKRYRFGAQLTQPDPEGEFTEIPIAAHKVSPVFFWKFALKKLAKNPKHRAFGDGAAIAKEKDDVIRLLTRSSNSVVSIDGYKASYLQQAYQRFKAAHQEPADFVIIGHPKAFTPYSLEKTAQFVKATNAAATYTVF